MMRGRLCISNLAMIVGVLAFLAAILVCLLAPAAETFQAKLNRVLDGDTYWIEHSGGPGQVVTLEKVRLAHVDAWEHDQPMGGDAAQYADNTLRGQVLDVRAYAHHSYDRRLVEITVGGKSLNAGMVAWGFAVVDPRYSKSPTLLALQHAAEAQHLGGWAIVGGPVDPWDWRKFHHRTKLEPQRWLLGWVPFPQHELMGDARRGLLQRRGDEAH